ncbi:MAG: hypothetical protein KGM18_11240 [Sphingomonadales bacterium]|nr:hypothetical protein [Sphingomonadales bacterium]
MAGKIPRTVFALVEPAVWSLAARLLILTTERRGSKKRRPTVQTFYETGLVTALYEAMLMSPILAHMDIRHEEPYPTPGKGAPKQVDLWLRPHNGGRPMLIEAGDYSVGKVHRDLKKIKALNPRGTNWFLAFFRDQADDFDINGKLNASVGRKNGLSAAVVDVNKSLIHSFAIPRPNGVQDKFGIALLRGI